MRRLFFGAPVVLVARLLLGGLLIYAGAIKLPDGSQFAEAIANYRLLPAQANQLLAILLPWTEVLVGLLLIFGVWVRASALLALLMFLAFTAAVISALARGLDIDCGCFGTDTATRVGLHTLLIEAAGILLAVYLVLAPRRPGD